MARRHSSKTIRAMAEKHLQDYGIREAPVPVEDIARKLGAELRYAPYDDGELSGMVFRDGDRVVIGVNSLHHLNRQRFTIAHEIGHMLMHSGEELHIDRVYRVNLRDAVSSQATKPEEIEANRFAAELLMPFRFLVEDVEDGYIDIEDEEEIGELAAKYQVSVQAMTIRLDALLAY